MRSLFGGLIRSSAGSALQGVGQQSDGRTISEYVPKGFDAERLGINSWDYKYRCDRSTRACRASGVDACRDLRHELLAPPLTGMVVWRIRDNAASARMHGLLPAGSVSTTMIAGERWFRCVAANPSADLALITEAIRAAFA
jgi:hypothetical protein